MTYIPREGRTADWQQRELRRISAELSRNERIQVNINTLRLDLTNPPDVAAGSGALLFDPSTNQYCSIMLRLPYPVTRISTKFFWTPTDATSGDVTWISGVAVQEGSFTVPASYEEATTSTNSTDDEILTSTVTKDVKIRPNELFMMIVGRYAADATDTYANDARLLHIEVY